VKQMGLERKTHWCRCHYKVNLRPCVRCSCAACWPSVPESYSTETQETANVFLTTADHRTREEISPTEVPRVGREIGTCQGTQNDRRPGQDVVPKSTHQVEVSSRMVDLGYSGVYEAAGIYQAGIPRSRNEDLLGNFKPLQVQCWTNSIWQTNNYK